MRVNKYAWFVQMYVYSFCNNPKQGQILSRIFSRRTSKVLHAQNRFELLKSLSNVELSRLLHCKLSRVVWLWLGEEDSLHQLCVWPKSGITALNRTLIKSLPGNFPPAGNLALVSYSTDRLTGLLGSGMTVRFTDGLEMHFLLKSPWKMSW